MTLITDRHGDGLESDVSTHGVVHASDAGGPATQQRPSSTAPLCLRRTLGWALVFTMIAWAAHVCWDPASWNRRMKQLAGPIAGIHHGPDGMTTEPAGRAGPDSATVSAANALTEGQPE